MNYNKKTNTLNLVLSIAIPAILSNIILSLYYLIDMLFISRLGDKAIAAISIIYPVNVIVSSVSIGLGIGASAIISKLIGEGLKEEAKEIAGNSIIIASLISIFFVLIGLFFSKSIIRVVSSGNNIVDSLALQYLKAYLLGSIFIFIPNSASDILKGQGNTLKPMLILLFGVVCNIILDPILMFGLWRIPALGIRGAAIATNLSRLLAGISAFFIILKNSNEIRPIFSKIAKMANHLFYIMKLGVSSMIASAITACVVFLVNYMVGSFSNKALAFTGLMVTISDALILFPIYGIAQGLIPVSTYLSSSKQIDRLKNTIMYSLAISVVISSIGSAIFIIFPRYMLSIFISSPIIIKMGIRAFRIVGISYLFTGPTITCAAAFQGMGKGIQLVIITVMRSFGILMPLGYLLSYFLGLEGFWLAFIITELISFVVISLWLYVSVRKLERK